MTRNDFSENHNTILFNKVNNLNNEVEKLTKEIAMRDIFVDAFNDNTH